MKLYIRTRLLIAFGVVIILTTVTGYIGFSGANTINARLDTLYTDQTEAISSIKQINIDFYTMRVALRQAILESDHAAIEAQLKTISDGDRKVRAELGDFVKYCDTQKTRDQYDKLKADYDTYVSVVDQKVKPLIQNNQDSEAVAAFKDATAAATLLDQAIQDLAGTKYQEAKDYYLKSSATVNQARSLILGFALISILVGLGIGYFIPRGISSPLAVIAKATANMAVGNLNRDMSEAEKAKLRGMNDEIGEVSRALTGLRLYMTAMADAAARIAAGDLTLVVEPHSEKDELGVAFAQMIVKLREIVSHIVENANNLGLASAQLASAAEQTGQVTSQISSTVQQIAKGINQQTEAVGKTADSVEQMSRAIVGVAQGAQEQSNAVSKTSEITTRITEAIRQVAANAETGAKSVDQSTENARNGAKTVNETIKEMQSIKSRVDISAERVRDLGARSDQISAIVATIDDIAAQTNLLSLNAAIEAARAGEHGKGFAVVADEVRKLADRSSGATKEISNLINDFQKTISEAVTAMEEGAKEVETGVNQANRSDRALEIILQASETIRRQVDGIVASAREMSTLSDELVSAMDTVSAVVEENTASTEQMEANSDEVTQAVETIASVSEENSAAAEEVSASAEEMSAQAEEVSASAQSLSEMAQALEQLVVQFKVE